MGKVTYPSHRHELFPRKPAFADQRMGKLIWCSGCSRSRLCRSWYHCDICGCDLEEECTVSPPEINHPLHPRHPLTFLCVDVVPETANKNCLFCGQRCRQLAYHCSLCNFIVGMECVKRPPDVVIDRPKAHQHKLTLIPRDISFTCDACGEVTRCSPYVCLECNFMVHKDCANLPRVIKINRHQHRISRTTILGPGDCVCGVCRREVDGDYGAYSCSVCPYAVHVKCATREDVWDGNELEGQPEKAYQEVKPFETMDTDVIKHFLHEHNLRLNKNSSVHDENKLCEACVLPIWSKPFYSCTECDFILDEACANLPREKHHELYPEPFSLRAGFRTFRCNVCDRQCSGFRYLSSDRHLSCDVRCGSLSGPFKHEGHPHPLYFTSDPSDSILGGKRCRACGATNAYVLTCVDCEDFDLCCGCATLPYTVRHKHDAHPAILRLGNEDVIDPCWCEICEEVLDPKTPFYASDECGFTSHVECLLGSFPFLKPGRSVEGHRSLVMRDFKCVAIENVGTSRPFCWDCKRRCHSPLILKSIGRTGAYLCSLRCLRSFAASRQRNRVF